MFYTYIRVTIKGEPIKDKDLLKLLLKNGWKDVRQGGTMKFIYPAIIHDDADGFWTEFPDLEYTSSTGSTLTELVTNAQEAMELYILGALEDGQSLPTPTSIRDLPCTDTTYPTLVQTDIDLAKNSKSVKKTLTIPAWLNDRALAKGINFSQILQEALVEKTM
mgnify:CR=1 FL=1